LAARISAITDHAIFSRSPARSSLLVFSAIFGLAIETASAAQGLFEPERLTGDWGGARQQWQDAGVEIGVTDVAETLSNPAGGIGQLTTYQGLLTASLGLDLEKIAKWPGANFHTDAYQISGRGLSRNAIGNLLAVSTIEALPSTRLHDLWLQQEVLDGKASFRLGQIALDDEFYVSKYSAMFINSTFGCPDMLSTDLPSGGPCYPFATPGVRVSAEPATGSELASTLVVEFRSGLQCR
jgi:porin